MAKKKNRQKRNTKSNVNLQVQKKSNLPLLLTVAVLLCIAIVIMMLPKTGKDEKAASSAKEDTFSEGANTSSNENNRDVQVVKEGESLVIPASDISSIAQFYPVEVDGTSMEILAVKDSDGNIRTAFNTCQICYSSGRGYYVQQEDELICQNCGNRFTVDQVEIESGGCNPWPIFAENKTVTEDSVEITYEFLKESKDIFANWKLNG